MIFVDSNIPMYLVGAEHPNKGAARIGVERAVEMGERLVTDAEVFQEILHRYVAINRREAIGPAFAVLTALVDEVFAVDLDAVQRARGLIEAGSLSARDAIHVAVMQREGVAEVLSFDRGFEGIAGICRLP
jgi:uncharacterized protein